MKLYKLKNIFIILFLTILLLLFSACSYAKNASTDISSNVFRLHVIANSDSEEDQNLKLKVRDNLLNYMSTLSRDITNKYEIINIVKLHQHDLLEIAQNTIYENGFDYKVSIEIGNFSFPEKHYGNISLPSGYYDALRVKIGESQGHNWWCVMFPPLCFTDISSGIISDEDIDLLKENLSEDDFNLISENDNITVFKFKIVDIFNDISSKITN